MNTSLNFSSTAVARRPGRAVRLLSVVVVALSLVTGIGASPAGAATYRASAADVSATLSFQGTYPSPQHTTLTISRAGHVLYEGPVSASLCGTYCWPTPAWGPASGNPVRVVTLRAGSPEVVLGLYSGGAHCCYIMEVFAPTSTSTYVKTEIDLGDPVAQIRTVGTSPYPVLVTADDGFAYAFTDYAASGLPIEILRFTGHGVADVTRQYPSLIRRDAASWLSAFYAQKTSHYSDSVGVIAAWAADEYLVGRAPAAQQFLREQARAGHLRSLLDPSTSGTRFVAQLETFLVERGYSSPH